MWTRGSTNSLSMCVNSSAHIGTSIFSGTDGVVAWQDCIQDGAAQHTENIEVGGSHFAGCQRSATTTNILP